MNGTQVNILKFSTNIVQSDQSLLTCLLESAYRASVANGIFKKNEQYGYARAAVVMSTQSETVFEWSVKLIGPGSFRVGIASQLQQEPRDIFEYDENSILYSSHCNGITSRSNKIHIPTGKHKRGDAVHFRFEPQTKKFIVRLVRI